MNYYLYKLKFSSPVHFGESDSARSIATSSFTFCADTLFSAMCCTLAQAGDDERIEQLCGLVDRDRLLFSDAMPYSGEELYIPRPLMSPRTFTDSDPSKRKQMKKLAYIPLSMWEDYCGYLNGKNAFEAQDAAASFGESVLSEKAAVHDGDDTEPYSVGVFSFKNDCGLYGIVGYEDESELDMCLDILKLVGIGGIGGKRTAGYGKYDVSDCKFLGEAVSEGGMILRDMLYGDASRWMLITTALPTDDELDSVTASGNISLTRRGGFSFSADIDTPQKKRTQYFVSSGSVVKERFKGGLYDVSGQTQKIFRYGKPLFLGVSVDD